mgnify:CR=1 FL=1
MKVNLTAEEKKQVEVALQNNKVRQWIEYKSNMKFEVGDVLICKYLRTDYTTKQDYWDIENIVSSNKMPQRYVYIYEDENGIGFMKRLRLSNGTLGKELLCMTEFNLSDTRFEVDPEYAESQLLDTDFSIKELHKKANENKNIVVKMNRKIGKKLATMEDHNTYFDTISVGDKIYTTLDYTGRYTRIYDIVDMKKVPIKIAANEDWYTQNFLKNNPQTAITHVYKIFYKNSHNNSTNQAYTGSLGSRDTVFYKTEPAKPEKK